MPNDMITLKVLSEELNDILLSGRIEKIYQPENDGVIFIIHAENKKYTLYMKAAGGIARCCLSNKKFNNPSVAPAFCMLLRKYLIGAKIEKISIFNEDRVLNFTFKIKSELFSGNIMNLFFEQMGKYANIVLTDENYIIKDALKRITSSETRLIMPAQKYLPEPLKKIPATDFEKVEKALKDTEISVALNSEIGGISKETEREFLFNTDNDYLLLIKKIKKFCDIYKTSYFSPVVRYENGFAKGFYFTPYESAKGEYVKFDTLSEAIEEFYQNSCGAEKTDTEFKKLNKAIKRLIEKYERRLSDAETKIIAACDAHIFKQNGDLIISNIHLIKKGDSVLSCYDFYNEKTTEIPLDSLKSPQKNAADYYKRYTKLKRGGEYAEKDKINIVIMLEYLLSVKESLNYCTTGNDYAELTKELYSLGGFIPEKKEKRKTVRSEFIENEIGGFKIYTGKNNIQNNALTFDKASAKDIWLHAKKIHGSHTIIKTEGQKVPDYVLLSAAEITAYFSEGRNSSKVEVDYTERKNVKKRENAPIGMVNYTNYKTVIVQPNNNPKRQF